MCACFCSKPSFCVTCVSEGTSLEEQVRRIKDIEAIESDSFVPQAFKSSRDDIKVRSVSLSLPAPHSRYLSLCLLLNLPLCKAVPSVQRQPRPNQTFIQRRLFQPETVSSGAPLFAASKGAAPTQKPQQATAILSLPLSPPSLVVQMQTKHRSHYWNVSEGEGIRFVGAHGCFEKIGDNMWQETCTDIWDASWWVWQRLRPMWLQPGPD